MTRSTSRRQADAGLRLVVPASLGAEALRYEKPRPEGGSTT
ncbi:MULTISPECIES: hypothetical protein [unclassified Isoptericola]